VITSSTSATSRATVIWTVIWRRVSRWRLGASAELEPGDGNTALVKGPALATPVGGAGSMRDETGVGNRVIACGAAPALGGG